MFRPKRMNATSRLSRSRSRKVALATLTTVGLSLLVAPGSAEAASYPSVQLEICNNSGSSDIKVDVSGPNQDGQEVSFPTVQIGIYNGREITCTTLQNYWWRRDADLKVKYFENIDNTWKGIALACRIPSSATDGSTRRMYPVLEAFTYNDGTRCWYA